MIGGDHLLDDVRLEACVIVHHDVVGGGDRALANVLRHQEEVIPVTLCHGVVQGTTV